MREGQFGPDAEGGGFREMYRAALSEYVHGSAGESALARAYELGRRAVAQGLSILDMNEIHQATLYACVFAGGRDAPGILRKSTEFLGQALASFEMMYKGYADTIAELRSLNVRLKEHANALQLSEERLRMFIKHNPAPVAMLDKRLRYLFFSPRWLSDYRLGERDIAGLSHYDVFPDWPAAWRDRLEHCLAGAVDKCDEALFRRADGTSDYVRWEIHPWYTEQQEIGGIIIFAEVITERRNQECRIQRLSRIKDLMSAINAAIVRIGDPAELLKEACRISVVHGNFLLAWAALVPGDGTAVRRVATQGQPGWPEEAMHRASEIFEQPALVARVLSARAAVICDDIAREDCVNGKDAHLALGCRSLIALPLFALKRTAGILILYSAETALIDREESNLLAEMAGDLSFALDHMAKEEKINYLAYYDALTDLPNRAHFFERLRRDADAVRRQEASLAVILLDIERFPNINDSFGRHAGDALLKEVAGRLKAGITTLDTAAHMSGATFGILLANIASAAEAAHRLEKMLQECFGPAFQAGGEELHVAVKAGISIFPADAQEHDGVYRNAEVALRKAQRKGTPYLFYRSEMNESVARRLTLENRLYKALERGEFVLHYQPKFHCVDGGVVGLESLLRWSMPDADVVQPSAFIPILEDTGMILQVGEWVMERAIADFRRWQEQGIDPPPIAVNISMMQLRQEDFVDVLRRMRDKFSDDERILDLEITESMMMEDIEQNIRKLRAAQEMGMKIAIDDFGTGYSSLSYLTKLPIDLLKIDRSFVVGMNQSASRLAIVNSIISLAHSLRLQVVAEGVDDDDQAKLLKLLGCDQLQGYLCSMPLPEREVSALLHRASEGA